MTTVADHDARVRIATSLDETLFVEAGAGSGKTSSLVARLVSLVLTGVPVGAVAAITFTEAAAAELRARVRAALERIEAGEAPAAVVGTVADADPDAAVALARTALDELDRATICTLHAFAQRLLLAMPVEAALPPVLDIHDELSSALRYEDRWHRFERALLDDDDLEVLVHTAMALGISSDQLQGLGRTLSDNWDLVEEARDRGFADEAGTGPFALAAAPVARWIDGWDEILALADTCTEPDDTLRTWIGQHVRPLRRGLDANRDDPYVVLELCRTFLRPGGKGRAASWPDGNKDAVVERCRALCDEQVAHRAAVADAVVSRLGAEIAVHVLADADARRAEGTLEFHDLLVLARRLLRTSPAARRRFHDQYRHLLIDEFQDTDPLQVELAVRIAADPDHDTSLPWSEVPVAPGRLFFVGDPKQSIYRFRRADIALFARTKARHAEGATGLVTNFRTVAPILTFCNAVFGQIMGDGHDDDGRRVQPPYVDLGHHRRPAAGDPGPPVLVLAGSHPSVADAKVAEAGAVAAALRRARHDGWLVDDGGAARPCRWGDMTVLLPSRTTLPQLRAALDGAAVPYRIESGTLVYGTTEIDGLLAVLRAVDDPGDEISVVGALRSPAYGCGDDDLHRWARSKRFRTVGPDVRPDDELAADPDAPLVERGLADLRRRHRSMPFQSVPEIVDAVVRDHHLLELGVADGGHRDVWRLYRVVLEHARQYADTESGGLRGFLRWVALQADDKVRASSPVIPEADVDAVRVMTIHGAKGLEFPITVVSGLSGADPNGRRGPTVLFRDDGGYEIRMRSGMQTTRFDDARTLEETMDEHERIRLLYVALTRARDHLVVSAHHKAARTPSGHGARLAGALAAGDVEYETAGPSPAAVDDGAAAPPAAVAADLDPDPVPDHIPARPRAEPAAVARWQAEAEAWRTTRQRLLDPTAGSISATALAARLGVPDAAPARTPVEPEAPPWRRGRGGTHVGSAVHGVLQHVDLDADDAVVTRLARWQAEVEGVTDEADLVAAKVRAALDSDLLARARRADRVRREVHLAATLADLGVGPAVDAAGGAGAVVPVVEGFVDLLIDEGPAGLVVVDYKTDAVHTDADVRRALARYAPQGATYAALVEAVTGRAVAEVRFLFLPDAGAVDVAVDDLPARIADVRAALAGLAEPAVAS